MRTMDEKTTGRICPLLAITSKTWDRAECHKERCAWACGNQCAVALIADALDYMTDSLDSIAAQDGITTWPQEDGDQDDVHPSAR